MPVVKFQPISVGDQRPVAVRIRPSDGATVLSASYQIVRKEDALGAAPFDPGGPLNVTNDSDGVYVATKYYITFPKSGTYIALFKLTWSDGQIDNTVSAIIPVYPLIPSC